ncbi:hypothetical protein AB3464_15045 [Pseudomonas asplenii]|uniref:hypothetical protein n=1 Tax=Pseudomonas asplenii TaxID=53407 RepID=UPI0037C860C7
MKSQDILLLFKLISLEERLHGDVDKTIRLSSFPADKSQEPTILGGFIIHVAKRVDVYFPETVNWQGWDQELASNKAVSPDSYTVRSLAQSLSMSKSEVANSLTRSREIGLVTLGHESGLPIVNKRALLDIVTHAIKYIFPVKPGAVVRGIPTAFAAPILEGRLRSGGDMIPVWPDPQGNKKGQAIAPIYKTVPEAVKRDYLLYHYLALVDAIRLGSSRESAEANQLLRKWILHE